MQRSSKFLDRFLIRVALVGTMGRHCETLLTGLLKENILTLDFALNHGYLGRGFRVEGWTWPRPRPVISFGRFREERCGGYSAAVTRLPAAQFPHLAPDPGTVAGDWVCPGLGYTLAMGGAESFTATTTIRAAQWVLASSAGGYYTLLLWQPAQQQPLDRSAPGQHPEAGGGAGGGRGLQLAGRRLHHADWGSVPGTEGWDRG